MMALAIVRLYPRTRSAKAVYSALNQICEMSGGKLLCSRSPSRAACAFALYVVIWLIPGVGIASEVLEQRFDGIVAPRQWVQVVPKVDGVISRILFAPGQRVSKGDVLFEMDADDYAIDVRVAQSELAEARASLSMAEGTSSRTSGGILKKNATAKQLARQTEIEVEIARAIVARNESALAKAQSRCRERTLPHPSREPFGRPHVALPGAFVEATTGTVLKLLNSIQKCEYARVRRGFRSIQFS